MADRFEKARLEKLDKIEALGHDPWGQRFDDHAGIAAVREIVPEQPGTAGETVRLAGRIMLRRKAGKLRFYDIKDQTGRIQLLFSRGDLSEEQWKLMSALDLGDLIGIDGIAWRTDSGEPSVKVSELTILCKSLTQPPEKISRRQGCGNTAASEVPRPHLQRRSPRSDAPAIADH